VPVCVDVFALEDLRKALLADDKAGVRQLRKAERLFDVPLGTALRVIEYKDGTAGIVKAQNYEVRVVGGEHEDKKGYTFAPWARGRVEVKPKRKR
jgi:hypothetical protein